uniref:NOP2/Sun RNA methyltransferase family member 7 n=1 Tax=Neogobius melanostomus TaxID=47308 RepID=A0A8C6U1V1_9GOBI
MQRAAYELAFNALKYQELLETILLDSSFYLTQPLPDDQMSLVVVILYDLQERKFVPRKCDWDEFIKDVRDVELHLDRFASKFAASLARWRIKHELVSIECMLPENVRIKQERASSLMLYAWVNSLKSSLDEVHGVLGRAGFSRMRSIGQLQGKTYCQDPHCEDILVFPVQMKAQLDCTNLLSNHKLIVQDKACCVGPNAACRLLQEAKNGDVLMAGCFSGLTVSHTASLISLKQKSAGNDKSTVFMCVGDRTEAQRENLQRVVNTMGCKNVKLIPGDFHSLDRRSKQYQKVRVILLAPKSSLSAISNPMEFILQEDGDTDLLQDLARGSIAKSKLESLVLQQKKDIDHAMQFPKILSVIYTTYSSHPEENEEVVRAVFEQARACGENGGSQTSLSPFSSPLDSKDQFFKLDPTQHNNGCFMAIFTREAPHDVKDAAADLPADGKKTGKSQRKKSQSSHSVRLIRREAKTNGSSTSIKKTSVPSPKVKESAEVLLARITSRDSQKSRNLSTWRKLTAGVILLFMVFTFHLRLRQRSKSPLT